MCEKWEFEGYYNGVAEAAVLLWCDHVCCVISGWGLFLTAG